MIPRQFARSPATRPPGTRTARADPRQRRLESLSAEFALLAQRRARVAHQIDLLGQQHLAASLTFARLQARMGWLAQRMDALEPALRGPEAVEPEPPPPLPLPAPRPYPPALPGLAARKAAPAAPTKGPPSAPPAPDIAQLPGRQRLAIHPGASPRKAPRKWRV
jgi:uncharacterized coiled-coil protein SlyX